MEALIGAFLTPGMWNVALNMVMVSVASLYLLAIGVARHRFPRATSVSPGRKMLFLIGLVLLYLALGSPLYEIGHELFSAHMLQQSILYLVMPPLLIRGIPDWMWRWALTHPPVRKWADWGRRPIVGLVLFNGLFSFYHVPWIFDSLMGNEGYHLISHAILTLAAFQMWWPVMTPLEEETVLSPLRKLAYIAAAGILLTPACALIIFADHLLFASFSQTSALFPVLAPRYDQQFGGVIMKIMQEITYGIALGHVFWKWIRREGQANQYGVPDNGPEAHMIEGENRAPDPPVTAKGSGLLRN